MNASLALQARLSRYTHLAVDWDADARRIRFIPVKSENYKGAIAYRLMNDGGKNTVGRAIYLHIGALDETQVPTGRYTAQLGNADSFLITY